MDKKRFQTVFYESSLSNGSYKVVKDMQTGVLYLHHSVGYGGGLTPLLDSEGKPIVDKSGIEEKK